MPSIQDQEQGYRRGLVLGLTMAEIAVLVIFVLLLVLGTLFARQAREAEDLRARNRNLEAALEQAAKAVGRDPKDIFQEEEFARLKQLERELDLLRPEDMAERPLPDVFRELVLLRETIVSQGVEPTPNSLGRTLGEADQARETMKALGGRDPAVLLEENKRLTRENEKLGAELTRTKEERDRMQVSIGHTWPPIITLKEAEGYQFETGKAELREEFESKLKDQVVPTVLDYVRKYDVDVIEIVGHTDERRVVGRESNLDTELLPFLIGDGRSALVAADNAGLGMARAATVARFLREDGRLRDYIILPLSGGQVVDVTGQLPDGTSPGDVPERRRIEIRLRRSESALEETESAP